MRFNMYIFTFFFFVYIEFILNKLKQLRYLDIMVRKDVSIILVSYKTKDLTRNCIKSIVEKTKNISYDIFVVDNNSQDGTCEMLKEEFPFVKLIENSQNIGFGAANNLAIKESDAEYVFLLNTDTLLVNNAVKILHDFLENNRQVGVCGANLYDENMNHIHSYGVFLTLKRQMLKTFFMFRIFFPNEMKLMFDKGYNQQNELKSVDYITGADMMVRKSVLDEAGLFDERFFLYFEENELQYRIRKSGYDIFINPEAQIIHLHGKSPKENERKVYEYRKSQYLFLRLCYGNRKNIFWIKSLMLFNFGMNIFKYPKCIAGLFKYILNDCKRTHGLISYYRWFDYFGQLGS